MRLLSLFAATLLTICASFAASAQDAADATSVAVPPGAPEGKPLTAQDVDAWLDGFLPYALRTGDIAGAVVAVVKDGEILTERGYGYADVAKKTPVDPDLTLFRPGSVSKLVTWTAVMQLVEQGKLDLDKDINGYLDFVIPPRDGKPVTLRNVMQHVGGFEEQIKDIISFDPHAPAFDVLLKRWVPARVFAPGTTPAYSNYATSVAGYIVQRVSGEPFDEYVERHIFAPLDMAHSTFRQPLPKELEPLMSTGYKLASGEPMQFEIVGPAPAGALSATARDMAHFMIAHLQNGQYQGNRILKEETAKMMHDSPLTLLPPLNRMELGFFETNINGREVIAHLGDTDAFHTSLHLFLKENVGFYVSFNSPGKAGAAHKLRLSLFAEFADRYFPGNVPAKPGVDDKTALEHARMMVGNWVASRGSQTTFLSAVGLIGQTKIELGPKGEMVVDDLTDLNGKPTRWIEVAPFVWKDANGHDRLAAKVENGQAVRWSFDVESPFTVFDRPSFVYDGAWLVPGLYAGLVVLLLTVVLWPVRAIVRKYYGRRMDLPVAAVAAYRWSRLAALAILLGLGLWAFTITTMFSNLDKATAAMDGMLRLSQIVAAVTFIGGFLVMLRNLWAAWRVGTWPAKVWSVALAFSAFIVLWIALVFHLIGWGVNF